MSTTAKPNDFLMYQSSPSVPHMRAASLLTAMTPQPPRRLGRKTHFLAARAPSCQMALDPTERSLLLTESVSKPEGYPGTPVLRLARIDLTTRAVAVLSVKLPRGGGMDPYTGMSTAW